ncbi:MAG: prepilin-type N-terminal cleavage/methylation domain-containing protein [Clostridia bacterium]|nr:prepilin-type N-terminal cleavage/methylation domain-containing protein [Clostridia bacterium]MBQ5792888.1 prepilin-type N-terminal cleavage/methylation domain-containing protein [Clostridia bacterium]
MKKFLNVFLKNHKGVSMVEVLVTVAMLAIVVVPCLSSFVMAQRGNAKAAETQAAYTAAANLMEELKGLPDNVSLPERLNNDEYSVDDVKINKFDGVHVIYEAVNEGATTYYKIWIYAGEGDNKMKENDSDVTDDYILKGVIVP